MSTGVSIVGSTGSIGTQTIDVVRADPERFRVVALAAGRSVDALAEQASLDDAAKLVDDYVFAAAAYAAAAARVREQRLIPAEQRLTRLAGERQRLVTR